MRWDFQTALSKWPKRRVRTTRWRPGCSNYRWIQFTKQFELEASKQAGNPVFKTFFPNVSSLRQSQARADVYRALLETALDIQLAGRDALKNHV